PVMIDNDEPDLNGNHNQVIQSEIERKSTSYGDQSTIGEQWNDTFEPENRPQFVPVVLKTELTYKQQILFVTNGQQHRPKLQLCVTCKLMQNGMQQLIVYKSNTSMPNAGFQFCAPWRPMIGFNANWPNNPFCKPHVQNQ
ncbi:hypothetical protein CPC16_000610, partial [Podila verticillata]